MQKNNEFRNITRDRIFHLNSTVFCFIGKCNIASVDDIQNGSVKCCKENCFDRVTREVMTSNRDMFNKKNKIEQKQFVLDYLNTHSDESGKIGFFIGQQAICPVAWRTVIGLSRSR